MSADRRPSQAPETDVETRTDREATDAAGDVELEFSSIAESTSARSSGGSVASTSTTRSPELEPPLSHRIEQTKLRARVTALERALETSESRQREIVTQYERLLAERTDEAARDDSSAESTASDGSEDAGLLRRLLEHWR